MDKADPPESFGVFNPVGHTVIAYRSADAMQPAVQALLADGFTEAALVRYSAAEMLAQTGDDLHSATALASLGQGLNLVKAHRELAQQGCSFLVVQAPDDAQAERVAAVALATHAVAAQRYGRFIVEELVDQVDGEAQVFESPARGLDIDAPDKPGP